MMKFLSNPLIFNIIIAILYFMSAVRFAFDKQWIQVLYFILLTSLTLVMCVIIKK